MAHLVNSKNSIFPVAVSCLGSVLEYFDFMIFGLFAVEISQAFFPYLTTDNGLVLTFIAYGVAFFIRPLGGVVFGWLGDKVSVPLAFKLSILLMAVATLGIGLSPDYATAGHWAAFCLVSFRLLQGFTVGGEIPNALCFLSERMKSNRGAACAFIFVGTNLGCVMGYLVRYIVKLPAFDSCENVWRYPFLIGGMLGLLIFLLRLFVSNKVQINQLASKNIHHTPFNFKQYLGEMVQGVFLVGSATGSAFLLFTFLPSYLTMLSIDNQYTSLWLSLSLIFSSFIGIFTGYLSDIFSRQLMVNVALLASPFLSCLAFYTYQELPVSYHWIGFLCASVVNGLMWGSMPACLVELFPKSCRSSALGVCFNIGVGIVGAGLPALNMAIMAYSSNGYSPVMVISFMCFSALVLSMRVPFAKEILSLGRSCK